MAQNFVQEGKVINAAASYPTTPASGDPVVVGQIPGVAITDESDGENVSGETSIATEGVFDLLVGAVGTSGAAQINPGDKLYYVPGDTPKINKHSNGANAVLFGKSLGTVTTVAATATIPVLLIQA